MLGKHCDKNVKYHQKVFNHGYRINNLLKLTKLENQLEISSQHEVDIENEMNLFWRDCCRKVQLDTVNYLFWNKT